MRKDLPPFVAACADTRHLADLPRGFTTRRNPQWFATNGSIPRCPDCQQRHRQERDREREANRVKTRDEKERGKLRQRERRKDPAYREAGNEYVRLRNRYDDEARQMNQFYRAFRRWRKNPDTPTRWTIGGREYTRKEAESELRRIVRARRKARRLPRPLNLCYSGRRAVLKGKA